MNFSMSIQGYDLRALSVPLYCAIRRVKLAQHRNITIAQIQRRVSEYYGLRPFEMTSARRAREVARPRQVAMYLCRELTPRSLPDIGRRFGDRDHTTVMHAIRQIKRLREIDAEMDADVFHLIHSLEAA